MTRPGNSLGPALRGRPRRAGRTLRAGRARRGGCPRRGDEAGGAVSLWVVLMVPVSAFAAVVAMAGPQRMAAESSMDEAADDLAAMAVAWRDGQNTDEGALPAFPPECSNQGQQTRFDSPIEVLAGEIEQIQTDIDDLPPGDPQIAVLEQQKQDKNAEQSDLERQRDAVLEEWRQACEVLFEWIVRDLGGLGVDINSLEGFYGDSLTAAPSLSLPLADPNQMALPCKISERVEVRDAVHVALAADWEHAGWAAAQVWPDGTRVAAESIGRMRRNVVLSTIDEECLKNLDVLNTYGRPVVLDDPDAPSRKISQSVPGRTVING